MKHHQLWLSYHLNCAEHLLYPLPEFSPKVNNSRLLDKCERIKSQVIIAADLTNTVDCIIHHHKWLKIQSTVYKVGNFILLDRDEFTPKFGMILDIIHVPEQQWILLDVEEFVGDYFISHFNAFVVVSMSNAAVVDVHLLQDYHSYTARKGFNVSDNSLYIVLP